MNSSLELGTIRGIRFGVNWSWVVIFGLIVWTLATAILPDQNPGLSETTYYMMAAAAALLFFASLLAHEFGHAIQAQREGMEIEGITLWLFGGVAKFRGMFPSAGAEFRIAIAGPLVSLVLGLLFVLVAWQGRAPEQIDGVAAWLGYINLVLLVFNLLPALPLDGGRVLRSALWSAKRDFAWATRIAANVGRGFGALMIGAGIFLFIFEGTFSGAWLAFIGWFLLSAASSELGGLATRRAFQNLLVRDLMVRDPVTTDPELTLEQFMESVVSGPTYATYPVVEHGRAVGLLPVRSLADVPRGEWRTRRVRDLMVPRSEATALREDEDIFLVLPKFAPDGTERALVLDGDRLVGLLSVTDLLRVLETDRRR